MGFRLPGSKKTLFAVSQASSRAANAPKGYLAVYVGEKMKRFMIPLSYLNQPSFQDLLSQAEEEFRYEHSMGGLTIPCSEDVFNQLRCEEEEDDDDGVEADVEEDDGLEWRWKMGVEEESMQMQQEIF
ncbi:auxin-induced protein 15A-like [Vigna radiata var. radiata]|uniref:Auxin-induced protein 15A-like n=1 Tax=Vigna radiata var. radiata TaxID=3916 RepID=A0A1S3UZG3_VIGRR|nr:auxin-induced protein 15A-like [Vigna radiata var. radiata]